MISPDLKAKISEYVASRISLADLEEWMAPRSTGFYEDPYSLEAKLTGQIDLALIEISNGLMSEDDLRQVLATEIARESGLVVVFRADSYPVTGSSSVTVTQTHVQNRESIRVQLTQLPPGYTSPETAGQ
jgi:hypothetical protein